MVHIYPAIFKPNDDGSITVDFPGLECTTEGKDLENAIYMARDCLALWLDTQDMLGEPIPAPSPVNEVRTFGDHYVTLIDADPEVYARQRKSKAIKRTVSLPVWLDNFASRENISLSKELQSALTARFQHGSK